MSRTLRVVSIDAEHPLRFEMQEPGGGLKPDVRVRGKLEALLIRAVYAEFAELAEEKEGEVGVRSGVVLSAMLGKAAASIPNRIPSQSLANATTRRSSLWSTKRTA